MEVVCCSCLDTLYLFRLLGLETTTGDGVFVEIAVVMFFRFVPAAVLLWCVSTMETSRRSAWIGVILAPLQGCVYALFCLGQLLASTEPTPLGQQQSNFSTFAAAVALGLSVAVLVAGIIGSRTAIAWLSLGAASSEKAAG